MSRERLIGEEALSLYAAGRRDFSFTNIVVCDWDGRDLSGIDLTGANVGDGTMRGINLNRACLFGACFDGLHMDGANLTKASLTNARFSGNFCSAVNFTRCGLENVVFTYTDLRNSNFQGAYAESSIWISCDFTGADTIREVWDNSGGIGYWQCIFDSGGNKITGGNLFS